MDYVSSGLMMGTAKLWGAKTLGEVFRWALTSMLKIVQLSAGDVDFLDEDGGVECRRYFQGG